MPPVRGDPVSRGEQKVGAVTSAAWSPAVGWVIALALLRVDAVAPTDALFVDRGGWALRGKVHPLPFRRPGAEGESAQEASRVAGIPCRGWCAGARGGARYAGTRPDR